MSFKPIKDFEDALAAFFGAPYAVATDCCTHALELCLRYKKSKSITVPRHTYISVPMLSKKLGINLEWVDSDWLDYYNVTDDIVDAAVLWKPNSYVAGKYMCVSFQFKKHLSLGRGGVILLDDKQAAVELKKMSYDGRVPEIPWATQEISTMGYHYYMTPETALLGLEKLEDAKTTPAKQWTIADWPNVSEMPIFQTSELS